MSNPMIDRFLTGSGVTAAGASSAPTPWYGEVAGDALVSFGPLGLAWAEWFQILAAIYVAALLLKMAGFWRLLAKWWKK